MSNGPGDAEVDVHGDGTFNVGGYDNDYLSSQWDNGGTDGRGETTHY